ncbi:MAG: hypothetical protein HY820_05080 [Acidobacteria bacterium]|nr:hypothetical protein [Acidobacteriota bacterium]
MKILIDECVDQDLRHAFSEHECVTCGYAGFNGLKNGKLLDAAVAAGFQLLITVDRNIGYQQNIGGRAIAVVVLVARTSGIDDLLPLIPAVLASLGALKMGEIAFFRA